MKSEANTVPRAPRLWVAEPNTAPWHEAWDGLKALTGDVREECPATGEVWQYMATVELVAQDLPGTEGRQWFHEFRHRSRPAKGMAREYLRVPVVDIAALKQSAHLKDC